MNDKTKRLILKASQAISAAIETAGDDPALAAELQRKFNALGWLLRNGATLRLIKSN